MRDKTFRVHTKAREEILIVTDEVQHALGELTSADGITRHRPPGLGRDY